MQLNSLNAKMSFKLFRAWREKGEVKMKPVYVLVFDVEKREFRRAVCKDLDDYYAQLNCSCFDIATRKIGETYYDIYCDDEGLLKDNPIVSAINYRGEVMLVGNLIFAHHDEEGNTVGLKERDVREILHEVAIANIDDEAVPVVLCEY